MNPYPGRPIVVHPFFFALFPILALYVHNVRSIAIPWTELAVPLGISLACCTVFFLALRIVIKDAVKAGIVVSLFLMWFLSVGHLAAWISSITAGIHNRSVFPATFLIMGLMAYAVVRSRHDVTGLNRILNVMAVTLVAFNLVTAGQILSRRVKIDLNKDFRASVQVGKKPNIYFVVFDAYTRSDVLEEVFGFDNSVFLSSLEERGFAIARHSYANYGSTEQSLAATLNFTLLDSAAKEIGLSSSDHGPLREMIRQNRAMAFLRAQGYRIMTASSSFEPTDFRDVDRYYGSAGSPSEFRAVLLETTPLPYLKRAHRNEPSFEAHRRRILSAFQALEESPHEQGPFFMFVHIMSPHPPFVFKADGIPVDPDYLFTLLDADRLHGNGAAARTAYIAGYRDQVAFINKKILETIDSVLNQSSDPPIIILQGDHGSRAYMDFDHPETSFIKENLAILNACYLPGDGRLLIYPTMSPVNTFRIVFDHYFSAGMGLLEDRSVLSTWRRPYRYISVTEADLEKPLDSIKSGMRQKSPIINRR